MKHLFANLDAVLFDLDGTLVKTNIDFALMKREMVKLAEDQGIAAEDLGGLDILGVVGKIVEHIRETQNDDAATRIKQTAFDILEEIEMRRASDTTEIAPARELLGELRKRGIKIGIATRNCRTASIDSLTRTGLIVDALVSREDVEKSKPEPDHLFAALNILSVKPERSLMVGDHLMDIASGKAAGVRTIGVLNDGQAPDYFDRIQPDAVAGELGELLIALVDCNC